MHSFDTLPNAQLEEAAVLMLPAPNLAKPTPITKDKQQDQSLTLFSSAEDILACSTSVCHEGFTSSPSCAEPRVSSPQLRMLRVGLESPKN